MNGGRGSPPGPPGRSGAGGGSLLRPGGTCWRVEKAGRVSFLVDGESYFRAFHETVSGARRSVFVIGWDLDTRVRLLRGEDSPGGSGRSRGGDLPDTLEGLLRAAVKRRKQLRVHILVWDFAMVLAHERQWAARLRLGTRHHRRLHLQLDGEHPVGASHHQKVVVVDGEVAFVGGLDLTRCRWDTPEHRAEDSRRVDTGGRDYHPFHDVQTVVDGPAAAALAELAAERWRRATGKEPGTHGDPAGGHCWPESVSADLEDVEIGIARTEAGWKGRREVREIEELYLASIQTARKMIYIESQYLTSSIIAEALARRLQKEEGPEVLLVSSVSTHGWLAERLMDALRVRFIKRLREADRHGRLRIWYPAVPGGSGATITVHSKLMIVDDVLVRVGSSNLSNRSMGLDSECDVAVEETGNGRVAPGIGRLLHRLLGEHLGRPAGEVRKAMEGRASPSKAIESLMGGERTFKPLEPELDMDIDEWLPDTALVDPERPVDGARLMELFLPAGGGMGPRGRPAGRLALLALVPVLAALWAWTPLGDLLDTKGLVAAAGQLRGSAAAPLAVAGAFVAGSLAVFPVSVLIAATALVFGPVLGTVYALGGSLLGGAATYAVGAVAGRELARRLAGTRLDGLSRCLAERGLLAMALVRLVPVAPFTVVNVVAGARRMRLRDFLGGTLLGMAPGVLAIALLAKGVESTILDPSSWKLGGLVLLASAIAAASLLIGRWVEGREQSA